MKTTKPFLHAIGTSITQFPERGTGTVDVPPWSDEKK
jgi:hypothetical protein